MVNAMKLWQYLKTRLFPISDIGYIKDSKYQSRKFILELTKVEAREVKSLFEAIIRDNTPNNYHLEGRKLVDKCLLHNDPENFKERNKIYIRSGIIETYEDGEKNILIYQ